MSLQIAITCIAVGTMALGLAGILFGSGYIFGKHDLYVGIPSLIAGFGVFLVGLAVEVVLSQIFVQINNVFALIASRQ